MANGPLAKRTSRKSTWKNSRIWCRSATRTLPALTSMSMPRQGAKHEKRSLVWRLHPDRHRRQPVRADAAAVGDDEWPPWPVDARAHCGGDHAWLPHGVHADGNGRDLHL